VRSIQNESSPSDLEDLGSLNSRTAARKEKCSCAKLSRQCKTMRGESDATVQKILVTGMSGLIGGAVRKQLEGNYQLYALNRRRVEGVDCYQADISDFDAILPAFKDKDAVIHLATTWRGNPPWEDHLRYSIVGTYNVFEASRRGEVKRIIYASSGAVTSGWERVFPYNVITEGRYAEVPKTWKKLTHKSPTHPTGIYGCTKIWGEALARHYSDAYGISAICLRIGAVNSDDRPLQPRHFSIWCSQRDVATMVEKCIQAPDSVKFDIFYVVSRNRWNYRDLEHARQVVGFIPQDTADKFQMK
jgi:dTDP-4-dehydrorhamnose reductase